tara:strand:+ start:1431 stop:1667 length:237 start_codon:yes stop_codon:yes gene_type:complete
MASPSVRGLFRSGFGTTWVDVAIHPDINITKIEIKISFMFIAFSLKQDRSDTIDDIIVTFNNIIAENFKEYNGVGKSV